MKVLCRCQAEMTCEEADETASGARRLTFVCPACQAETVMAETAAEEAALDEGRLLEAMLARPVWTHQARSRLDRIPPFAWPAVQEEVERYATASGRRLITAGLVDEAQRKGTMAWAPEAEQRLQNVPEVVRAMARAEIEKMARARGETTVTESLMDEAKGTFLGFRGPTRPPDR